jgi:hypothetical protein
MDQTVPSRRDLSNLSLRTKLKPRVEPYWSMLCIGRGIGFLRVKKDKAF